MTVNGQTPFVTLWMYLNDAKDEKAKDKENISDGAEDTAEA